VTIEQILKLPNMSRVIDHACERAMARRPYKPGVGLDDLRQEALLALYKAVGKYDEQRGTWYAFVQCVAYSAAWKALLISKVPGVTFEELPDWYDQTVWHNPEPEYFEKLIILEKLNEIRVRIVMPIPDSAV
jgi:DNA-directed RNA polymerase specialized sigma24 family protein